MSTIIEPLNGMNLNDQVNKLDEKASMMKRDGSSNNHLAQQTPQEKTQQHPLHQYDLTIMAKFYESCVGKLKEQNEKWKPAEWTQTQPMPHHISFEQKNEWSNPLVLSQKQRVIEAFARFARESGEPMILMPNFDYGDILNFERFLQAMKQDGVNAIGKYKQYLNNKDIRKFEVDLVIVHARYGVLLVEVKDCDHLDSKRRSRARIQLNNARSCFESMSRLIVEAKGWTNSEAHVQITEFIAVPNVQERPALPSHLAHLTAATTTTGTNGGLQTPGENQNHSATSSSSSSRTREPRILNYIIKSDLDTPSEFAKWFQKYVAEPKIQHQQAAEADNKVNKFDATLINWMLGLINCIRNNSIMPVVYPETGESNGLFTLEQLQQQQQEKERHEKEEKEKLEKQQQEEQQKDENNKDIKDESKTTTTSPQQFQPALNLHGEFFNKHHESVRSLQKCFVVSKDSEKIRKTICLQTLWLMLNDSQKKISVLCSEMNKTYYDEFFARQRKLYNNFQNVRFYTDLQSCTVNTQNTLKKDNEIWFFDSAINGSLSDVMERVKDLNAFWVFTTQEEAKHQYVNELKTLNVRTVDLDESKDHHHDHHHHQQHHHEDVTDLMSKSFKFPLRLQCDLLVIGDIIGTNQLRNLYRFLKSNTVTNNASHYTQQNQQQQHYQGNNSSYHHNNSHNSHHHYNNNNQYHQHHQQQQQHLQFNPTKKFKQIKFIRGGSIDNLRNSLKMHDSIQANVILLHVGDEDLFKTRHSMTTIERVKELATLVKEYCPNSFVIISTLMRRMSRTENTATGEVNKGIINFCKQTKETLNCHYMLNNHFEPENHTQEGRLLNNKGLKLYVDNVLFVVDYFMVRKNKQH
jgi:hypothetical protein